MSRATIHIPLAHVGAIRESLEASRLDLARDQDGDGPLQHRQEIEALLDQLEAPSNGAARAVSGARDVLWHAAYDALCASAEAFAADCNDLWRGRPTVAEARAALTRLAERLDLLRSLGAPPADKR
jgi:hypothetical protein